MLLESYFISRIIESRIIQRIGPCLLTCKNEFHFKRYGWSFNPVFLALGVDSMFWDILSAFTDHSSTGSMLVLYYITTCGNGKYSISVYSYYSHYFCTLIQLWIYFSFHIPWSLHNFSFDHICLCLRALNSWSPLGILKFSVSVKFPLSFRYLKFLRLQMYMLTKKKKYQF